MRKTFARTPETLKKYQDYKKSKGTKSYDTFFFDLENEKIIREYDHWAIIPNDFPYDAIFSTHHLLVPKRVFATASEMFDVEFSELQEIKKDIDSDYQSILENLSGARSVHKHFHLHIFVWNNYK